jgi:hypothetical protein
MPPWRKSASSIRGPKKQAYMSEESPYTNPSRATSHNSKVVWAQYIVHISPRGPTRHRHDIMPRRNLHVVQLPQIDSKAGGPDVDDDDEIN